MSRISKSHNSTTLKITFLSFVFAFIVIGSADLYKNYIIQDSSTTNSEISFSANNSYSFQTKPENQVAVLGVSSYAKNYNLILNSIKTRFNDPLSSSGFKRITVSAEIENISAKSNIDLPMYGQAFIKDQDGNSYSPSPKFVENGVYGGSQSPHSKSNYNIDFELPETALPTSFNFQTDPSVAITIVAIR